MYEIEWKQSSAGWREPKCDGVDNSPWSWVSVAERSNAIEAALRGVLASATPNPRDNPAMATAWKIATDTLNPPNDKVSDGV
jgi:hypothetical protein